MANATNPLHPNAANNLTIPLPDKYPQLKAVLKNLSKAGITASCNEAEKIVITVPLPNSQGVTLDDVRLNTPRHH